MLQRRSAPFGPRNTWSNVAYAIAGFMIHAAGQTLESGIIMVMLVFLALGSGFYHSTKSSYYNEWDHNGMYFTFGSLAVYGWWPNPFAMLIVAFGLAWVATYWRKAARLPTQTGVLLCVALMPVFLHDWREGLTILAIYAFGYGVQRLDHAHSKLVRLYGHAFWHIITAIAIYLTALAQLGGRL